MNYTCDFAINYNKNRPNNSNGSHVLSICIICIFGAVMLLGTYWAIKMRDAPEFHRIRPPMANVILSLTCVVAVIAYLIPTLTTGYPCALDLTMHVLVAGSIWSFYALRCLIFISESEYSSRVIPINIRSSLHRLSDATSAPTGSRWELCSVLHDYVILNENSNGGSVLELKQLVRFRRYLAPIFCFVVSPQWILSGGVLAIGSKYRNGCVDCPVESGFLLVVFVAIFLGILLSAGIFKHTLCSTYPDVHHVRFELGVMMAISTVFSILGYGLEDADPSGLQYGGKFSWRNILCLWPISVGLLGVIYPVIRSISYLKRRRASIQSGIHRSSIVADMRKGFMEYVVAMPDLYEKYMEFAASRFSYESHFLRDVVFFRSRDGDVDPASKRQQVIDIYDTYLGADAHQEIQLPHAIRQSIVNVITSPDFNERSLKQLREVYSSAFDHVTNIVEQGVWVDFINENPAQFPDRLQDFS